MSGPSQGGGGEAGGDATVGTAERAAGDGGADIDVTEQGGSDGTDAPEDRCDYCRLSIPGEPVTASYDGVDYHFCSTACRERLESEDRVFTEFHGFRLFDPGIAALRSSLPQGVPRNSFVLVSGNTGTRDEAVLGEIAWRALQRGEPVVLVSFLDTPTAVAQSFTGMGWNPLPALDEGRLRIVDCFTYRLEDRERVRSQMNDWNRHLDDVAAGATRTVRDPTDPQGVLNALEHVLDELDTAEEGVVIVDSLTEFGSLVQPVQAYDFVKDLRASVPKARGVPVFAGATRVGDGDSFPHDLGYVADGIVDLDLSGKVVEDALVKRLRVRKMSGVLAVREWKTYEFVPGTGLVVVEEADEAEDATEQADEDGGTTADTDAPDPDGGEGDGIDDDAGATPDRSAESPPPTAGADAGDADHGSDGEGSGEDGDER